eukprot:4501107-Amphidinium_carterae.1
MERLDIIGNDLADFYAKKGAMEHIRGGQFQLNRYHGFLDLHTKALVFATDLQTKMWKLGVTDHPPFGGSEARDQSQMECGPLSVPHRRRRPPLGSPVVKWSPPDWLLA